jgi:hypothetical protein
MTLLNKLKEQLQAPTSQPTNLGGQTDTVRGLLQAKSGKEVQSSGAPRQSSIKEKMAEQQTRQAGQQLQQAGQIQAAQLEEREADIGQREVIQEQQFQENLKNIQANFDQRSNSILQQFESGQKRLDNSRDLEELEQVGFEARLQNKQYIDQLTSEGDKKRLDNSLVFKQEMARNVLKDNQDLLTNDLAFKAITEADDRQFQREIADMDINYAMDIANNAAKSASQRQTIEGVGGLVSAGIEYGAKTGAFSSGEKGKANLDDN